MPSNTSYGNLGRRSFLKKLGIASAGIWSAERVLADPYAFIQEPAVRTRTITIRGAVKSKGKGIQGVAVSDGARITTTNADGTYQLISSGAQPHVFLTLPSGYAIPTNPTGTARFYKALPADKGSFVAHWDLERLSSSDEHHTLLLLADPQTLDQVDMKRLHAETVPDIRSLLAQTGKEHVFAVGCGDLMFDRLELFPEYERAMKQIGIPSFQVLGNHDVELLAQTDEAAAAVFMQHFGPTYYSFDRGEVHYVVLDDVFWYGGGYIGYVEQQQIDWLKADLALVEKGKTVVVLTHIPPYNESHIRFGDASPNTREVVTNRDLLYRVLEKHKAHIIVGHMHETEHLVEYGMHIHVCGAVCGAWWTTDICHDGTPNVYGVYDVSGSELRWRYKATGHDLGMQLRVHPRGSDPKRSDEIVANVWDATPEWKIAWYENGERKGFMKRDRGHDPLAVKLLSGSLKHSWIHPSPTDHLYYASVSPTAQDVMVEATDQWGRKYTARL